MDIFFVTGNKGKVHSLQDSFRVMGRNDIKVIQKELPIIEVQADKVGEVSKDKALKAFEIIKSPVVVEDGSFVVDALNGFPGVYAKYVLGTIGADRILKLLSGEENRTAKFQSCTTYVDENGNITQFNRDTMEFDIAKEKSNVVSPYEWLELWRVLYVREFGKILCNFTKEELDKFYEKVGQKGSLQKFVNCLLKNIKFFLDRVFKKAYLCVV